MGNAVGAVRRPGRGDAAAGALGGDRAVVQRRDRGGPGGRAGPGGPQAAGRPEPTGRARHPATRAPSSRGRGRARRTFPTGRSRWRSTSTWPASSTCAPAANCASATHRRQGQFHRRRPAGGVRAVPPRRPREWHLGRAATAAADHRTARGRPAVRRRRRRRAVGPQQAGRGGLAGPVQLAVPPGRRPDRRTRAGPADRRPAGDAAQPAVGPHVDPGRRRSVARVRRPDRTPPGPCSR